MFAKRHPAALVSGIYVSCCSGRAVLGPRSSEVSGQAHKEGRRIRFYSEASRMPSPAHSSPAAAPSLSSATRMGATKRSVGDVHFPVTTCCQLFL